jgi:hypothetical protein
MNVTYRSGHLIGIRNPYSIFQLFWILLLLAAFFAITTIFASGRMQKFENWVIPLMFICPLLGFSMNKRKAVFNRRTGKLVLYDNWFGIRPSNYDLPPLRKQIELHTQQRIEYANRNRTQLVFVDLFVKLPEGLIAVDTVHPIGQEEGLREWEKFFSAVYDPYTAEAIRSGQGFRYWQAGIWTILLFSCITAIYLNISGAGTVLKKPLGLLRPVMSLDLTLCDSITKQPLANHPVHIRSNRYSDSLWTDSVGHLTKDIRFDDTVSITVANQQQTQIKSMRFAPTSNNQEYWRVPILLNLAPQGRGFFQYTAYFDRNGKLSWKLKSRPDNSRKK